MLSKVAIVLCASICILAIWKRGEKSVPSYLTNILYGSKTTYGFSKSLFKEFAIHVGIIEKNIHVAMDGDPTPEASSDYLQHEKRFYPDICKPEKVNLILRHGARYPSKGDIPKIAHLAQKVRSLKLSARHSKLKDWNNYFTMNNSMILAKIGALEHVGIAQRYVDMFPELFHAAVESLPQTFRIVSSSTERTLDSAAGFAEGLSNMLNVDPENLTSLISQRDDLMRFFDRCPRYEYDIEDHADKTLVEFHEFSNGPEMQEAARRISSRLSSTGDGDVISTEDLKAMWKLCAIEIALATLNYTSPWCDPITIEESRVLEYAYDLKDYWKKAFGYTINYEQSCPLLADVAHSLMETDESHRAPRVSLYFGHAETLNPINSLLGLFSDEVPLLASNYQLHRDNRKFRMSLVSPFAANLGFVKYSCQEGPQHSHPDWPTNLDSSMMQIVFNEQPIPFPFTDKMAVSFHDFETQYYQEIHHCNFADICKSDSQHSQRSFKLFIMSIGSIIVLS